MGTYDVKKVSLILAGQNISGFSPNSFLEVSYDQDRVTVMEGAQGEVAFSNSASKLGTLKISLLQTSEDHSFLTAVAASTKVFSMLARDASGKSLAKGTRCRIAKMPSLTFSAQASDSYTWEIKVADLDMSVGGNPMEMEKIYT